MKLIPLITLTLCLAVDNKAHEHFTFPPQFPSGMFTSEKNHYLPPEAHTPLPYFHMNNMNKLPFPYLPPTATKAPFGYPSPFPIISSTQSPPKIEDDDDEEDNKPTTPVSQFLRQNIFNQFNHTKRMANQLAERRELRPVPKSFQNAIDRIDTKMQFQFNTSPEPTPQNAGLQTVTPRSISIIDIQREHNMDQMKAASFPGAQYVPQPGIYISSTTETAIPILRLSNEMDLDGSFSYEALGADQTHYVQHSRMENPGTGKDEQVVEGSYSYVGDNGKTYTVNYIADANGFRASGDHLPVAPPVPEIIQRAIQYNLAEESKKPPHLKTWSAEQQENELSETEKRHQFAIAPPRLSNLFTGKTPESFSFTFSQPTNNQNNLVAAASSQSPVQAAIDFTDQMQTKQNSGTISPQITFLASQGAHVPSVNAPQQQPVNRMFTTEKSALPQLVNYEANMKESDQESNKALWRWQYGLNANRNANQNMEKNSISRSFGADDIVINFSDMNSEQYTKMMKEQITPSTEKINLETTQQDGTPYFKDTDYYAEYKPNPNLYNNDKLKPDLHVNVRSNNNQESTEKSLPYNAKPEKTDTKSEPKITYTTETPTTEEPTTKLTDFSTLNTVSSTKIKFSDFIVPENKEDFKPIFKFEPEPEPTTTTTETSIENVFEENIFLKNIFRNNKNEQEVHNNLREDNNKIQNKQISTKSDKHPKFIQHQPKPHTENKATRKKPVDIADILNYISRNQFESSRLKLAPKPTPNNFKQKNELRYYSPEQIDDTTEDHQNRNQRTLQQPEELRGVIKNYKVLNRNNNFANVQQNNFDEFKRNLSPTHLKSLPPLGRAGPSVKSYLPPIYV
ncbi:hypothetical protein PYW08_002730 [Mythimna loreyi]|uniref:Uncharacterized protein n=1 Tax=Mythimna loreyi TaxID=667449 RepID=A0ACC2QLE0_9NEOP|nr:hypothetical protein PYW08_002730 [Mythimna loreyi]